jgi:signal peptidase
MVLCPGTDFEELAVNILEAGHELRFRARGSSMHPLVRDGDILDVQPISGTAPGAGEVILYRSRGHGIVVHRVVGMLTQEEEDFLLVKGDAARAPDPQVPASRVLGRVVSIERHGRRSSSGSWTSGRAVPLYVRGFRLRRWADGFLKEAWRELRRAAGVAGYGA